ncbi:adenosine receptor A3-like [Pocillopora verrucosa]|uniref:adenosine receptor A3-like n=1 Tax=Pocillopora verrucosa TaxID=203993 RepID=UPI00333FCA5B
MTGNILIIWIFLKLRRRKRSSFLLIRLGLADLLVGGLTIPLFIGTYESASITTWRVFNCVDMSTSISSIYTLAVISVERMFAIGWPLRYRTTNFRVYICAIALPWIIAAILTITVFVNANFNSITRYSILNLLVYLQITANFSHLQPTVLVIRVLQYSNSFVNVIIYPLRILEFKNCLLHLLRS